VIADDGGAIIFENTGSSNESTCNNKIVTVDLTGSINVMIDGGDTLKWIEEVILKPGQSASVMLSIVKPG